MITALMLATAGFGSEGSGADEAMVAEQAGDFEHALQGYERCAEHGSASARICEARATVLRPQAADDFVGWRELEAVRHAYTNPPSAEALARIEGALSAHPESPAAPAMRVWLANEYARRDGDPPDVAHRAWSLGLTALSAVCFASTFRPSRREGLAWRSAALAAVMIGGVPLMLADLWGDVPLRGFVSMTAVVATWVLAARRTHPIVGAIGGFSGVLSVAAWSGWWSVFGE